MKKLKLKEYRLASPKVKKPMLIAMLADLHNQSYGRDNDAILSCLREMEPDLILLSGDMVVCRAHHRDKNLATARTVCAMADIAPVYYGLGNHEVGLKIGMRETGDVWEHYCSILREHPNVHILEDEAIFLPMYGVTVAGLSLKPKHYKRFVKLPLEKDHIRSCMEQGETGSYQILLAHHPDYFKDYVAAGPDLVFAGHNHGGMVRLPWLGGVISPRFHLFPRYDYGLYEEKDTRMIVTSGAGLHSINVRINNPPELVFLHIDVCK